MVRRSLMKKVIDNGLRIDRKHAVYYKTDIPIRDTFIIASMQVTKYHYRNCEPHTYNIKENVVVIVIERDNIVIVPRTNYVQNALRAEGYSFDNKICVPKINQLEHPLQARKWSLAQTRLS